LFGNSIVDNDTEVAITDENQPFAYTPVSPEHHSGEEICLAHLGVKTIEELCTNKGNL